MKGSQSVVFLTIWLMVWISACVSVSLAKAIEGERVEKFRFCPDRFYNCYSDDQTLLGQICDSTCFNAFVEGKCGACEETPLQKCQRFVDRYLVNGQQTQRVEKTEEACNQNSWVLRFKD